MLAAHPTTHVQPAVRRYVRVRHAAAPAPRDHEAGRDHLQVTEESGDLLAGVVVQIAVRPRGADFPERPGVVVAGDADYDQTARPEFPDVSSDQLPRLARWHEVEDQREDHADRLAGLDDVLQALFAEDSGRGTEVGPDDGHAFTGGLIQDPLSLLDHLRVTVDVGHPDGRRLTMSRAGRPVDAACGRQPGTHLEVAADDLPRRPGDSPAGERGVISHHLPNRGIPAFDLVGFPPVGGVVVGAAAPVVVHAGRLRGVRVNAEFLRLRGPRRTLCNSGPGRPLLSRQPPSVPHFTASGARDWPPPVAPLSWSAGENRSSSVSIRPHRSGLLTVISRSSPGIVSGGTVAV